ncbi:MAG: glycosyltransferase, partial [Lachnospiraceae bacterium]|nr:glycosyltransferase [Lachnospiraceae bacterium]
MRDKTDSPKISVIMGIYNQWNKVYLEQAIMSILRQSFWDFEFLIYNDGSDFSICEQLERYKQLDDRIVLLHGKE